MSEESSRGILVTPPMFILGALLVTSLIGNGILGRALYLADNRILGKEEQIESLQIELAKYEREFGLLKEEKESLDQAKSELEEENAGLASKNSNLQSQNASKNEEIAALGDLNIYLATKLSDLDSIFTDYDNLATSSVDWLYSNASFYDVDTASYYFASYNSGRENLSARYWALVDELGYVFSD